MKPSSFLDWVLLGKIAMTVVWVVFLLLSGWVSELLGIPNPEPMHFVILLAGAYIALLVGYVRAYWDNTHFRNTQSVANVVVVGIVSNGWGCLSLLLFGLTGAWNNWGGIAQAGMWFSTVIAGLITAGLIIARPVPSDPTLTN
jgi:hypothetical protein